MIRFMDASKTQRSGPSACCYATLLTIYHRIDREKRSESENGIRDRTLVDLY